ncbi:MAG: methyltransferase domain-containing protein [Deltaproteobacteria bacterium]|nr:methyltransferase domain-containing protein [Deltaproteobacteria bacterium]
MSIFEDPRAHVAMRNYHYRHYEGRDPSWYIKKIAHVFQGYRRVLDVGCGPGLCMRALLEVGVEEVIGLERDPRFLETARNAGLKVISHDLNVPFPFLESESFDGVVSYQTFDFLVDTAKVVCLRECWRVLKPGGKIAVYSQNKLNRKAQKDPCRIGAITTKELKRLLVQVGFHAVSPADNKVLADAHSPAITQWTPEIPEERLLTANATAFKPPFNPRSFPEKDSRNFLTLRPLRAEAAWKTRIPVQNELQISALLQGQTRTQKRGGMKLNFGLDTGAVELQIGAGGRVIWNRTEEIQPGDGSDEPAGICMRLQKSGEDFPEAAVWVWSGDRQALFRKYAFRAPVNSVTVSLWAEPESEVFPVDHISVLTFTDEERKEVFDAQVLARTSGREAQGGKKLTARDMTELFHRGRVERALILSGGLHDGLNWMLAIQSKHPDRAFPLIRLPATQGAGEEVLNRGLFRLETLWRGEQMIGLAVDLHEGRPHPAVLHWAEERRVITAWNTCNEEDLQWLEGAVLKPYRSPVVLSSFDGRAADQRWCRLAVEWMEKYTQLYVTTLFISCGSMLLEAARRAPERIVFGSNFPNSDPMKAISDIEALAVDPGVKQKILFDNLEQLVRNVRFFRQDELRANRR